MTGGHIMRYMVVVDFDLDGAESKDYACVKAELHKLGLNDYLIGDDGQQVETPDNTFAGQVFGLDEKKLADHILVQVRRIFNECDVTGPIFLTVGNCSWRKYIVK